MSAAGVFCSFAFFQVSAFLCHKNQSTILGLQNGAFNASAVILHIIKILYETQKVLGLEILLAIYCAISAVLVLVATFIFVPSKQQLIDHVTSKSLLKDVFIDEGVAANGQICLSHKDGSTVNSHAPLMEIGMNNGVIKKNNDSEAKFIQNKFLDLERQVDSYDDCKTKLSLQNDFIKVAFDVNKSWSVNNLERAVEGENMKLTVFNVILRGSFISLDRFSDAVHLPEAASEECLPTTGTQVNNNSLSFTQLLLSGIYLWHVFFASVFHLRLYLFITTFESLLNSITAGDAKTVNSYINILGIAQFIGLFFAPLLGPYIDRDPKLDITATFEDYRTWKVKRCARALFITNTLNVIMGIAVLIPVLEVQILSITVQVLLRGFFYAIHFTYFAVVFPPEHYGKLTCLCLLMGVIFGSLQYPLCMLIEQTLNNNPFWVNVGLLILSFTVYGQSLHLTKLARNKSTLWNR